MSKFQYSISLKLSEGGKKNQSQEVWWPLSKNCLFGPYIYDSQSKEIWYVMLVVKCFNLTLFYTKKLSSASWSMPRYLNGSLLFVLYIHFVLRPVFVERTSWIVNKHLEIDPFYYLISVVNRCWSFYRIRIQIIREVCLSMKYINII